MGTKQKGRLDCRSYRHMLAYFEKTGQQKSLTSPSVYPCLQKTLILQGFLKRIVELLFYPRNFELVKLWKQFFVIEEAGNDLRMALCTC